jgi:hypothetical protein
MVIRALGLFLVEISMGTAVLLLFFPTRRLGKGFFALHGLLAFSFLLLSAVIDPQRGPVSLASVALLAAYTLVSQAGKAGLGRIPLALASAGEIVVLAGLARTLDSSRWGWIFAGSVLGGLLFGCVLLTMNLGHWYLVSRSLPLSLLFRAAVGYALACVARAAFLAAAAGWHENPEAWEALTSLDRDALFFLFRILWGILGPLALSYFIFQTSRMRSNQAATGLLYVALVFVLIGELLAAYLTVLTRFPA